MKAVRCPVCAGTGEYYAGEIDYEGKLIGYRACHGCKDKDGISRGWVEVHEETSLLDFPASLPGDESFTFVGEPARGFS